MDLDLATFGNNTRLELEATEDGVEMDVNFEFPWKEVDGELKVKATVGGQVSTLLLACLLLADWRCTPLIALCFLIRSASSTSSCRATTICSATARSRRLISL